MTAIPLDEHLLDRLEAMRLRARRKFLGSRLGRHPSPRPGSSLEFADYRNWVPGDDPRRVDWALYARTRRPFVRVFEEEEDLFVYGLLDRSRSMESNEAKARAARAVLLGLSYAALSSGDTLRLARLGERDVRTTPFLRGRNGFLRGVEFLEAGGAGDGQPVLRTLSGSLAALRRPGKVIFVSDFLAPPDEVERWVALLRAANLDAALVQVLAGEELDPEPAGPVRLVDVETGETREANLDEAACARVRENVARQVRAVRSIAHDSGFLHILFDTRRDLAEFLLAEVPATGLLRT